MARGSLMRFWLQRKETVDFRRNLAGAAHLAVFNESSMLGSGFVDTSPNVSLTEFVGHGVVSRVPQNNWCLKLLAPLSRCGSWGVLNSGQSGRASTQKTCNGSSGLTTTVHFFYARYSESRGGTLTSIGASEGSINKRPPSASRRALKAI